MQEQKAGLNKREKRLLLVASVVGLFYLAFQFVFLPNYNLYAEKTDEYNDLLIQQMQVRADLADEAGVRSTNEDAKARYRELEAIYLLAGKNTDLGRMLTGLCRDNSLSVTGYTLGDPSDFRVPREGGETPGGDAAFSAVTVPMTVSGDYDAVKSLLDAVDENSDIRVSRLSFSLHQEDPGAELEQVRVTFVVTLLNGIE
ncbi:MAG: hypothetical protein LBI19_07425 [Oscillospiraceae bacterium]|jgi:hypothetical protein|nr:hypothetical protein [Oscillospiraceae bacterium]